VTALADLLRDWLPRQRWFATKTAAIDGLDVDVVATLVDTPETVVQAVVARVDAAGSRSDYFLPLALHRARTPERDPAWIGEADGWQVHDGALDTTTNQAWIEVIARGEQVGGLSPGRTAELPVGAGRPLGVEQSNTSIVYDDVICKLFRRLSPSPNPDLEVTRRLAELGSTCIAPSLGWLEGAGATLAVVQPFLRGATEGWAMALTSVRDLYALPVETPGEAGGDFAPEARRLGVVTATLHNELRAAFPHDAHDEPAGPTAKLMHARLDAALEALPQLGPLESRIRVAYEDVGELEAGLPVQRIHGDYHLGQVLRTQDGWVVLDFEGEPARPLSDRIAPMSPLRDVAGMLRSFDYAAKHLLADHERSAVLDLRAEQWAARNRDAFCAGYAEGAGADPREQAALLRAFELDKAIYEVRYEADHRPTWVFIPLGGLERLVA
jgi:maltokinase